MGGRSEPETDGPAIGMTESGLVYAGASLLVRMRKTADGLQDLAIGADRDRMLAMLSIAHGRPVAASEVVPHIETAADHWRRGDRALANLRLIFSALDGPSDAESGHRVAFAECLLDNGWPPAALLEELGFARDADTLEKYNPNHVPAGHGRRSGQFDFRSGGSHAADGRIIVAGGDNDENRDVRELLGETTPKEEQEHHHLIEPPPVPIMGGALFGSSAQEAVSAAARAAAVNVGPGKGPVYGTAVHEDLKEQVRILGRYDLHTEQSYLNGERVDYGTPGSVRPDVVKGSKEQPVEAYDLKTGGAYLSSSRVKQLQSHLPLRDDGTEVPIHEVRP